MNEINYISLSELNQIELLKILNKAKIRKHLVSHRKFNQVSLENWIDEKVKVDSCKGCKVRGVIVNGSVAGWCGIQFENQAYELAIVLDEKFWGIGISVFKEVLGWASELGHRQVVLHMLNSRPKYTFLRQMASQVYESTIFGQKFTSYEIEVPSSS